MFSHHYQQHVPPQSLPRTGYSAAHLLWLIAIHFPHITPPLHLCSIFTLSHHLFTSSPSAFPQLCPFLPKPSPPIHCWSCEWLWALGPSPPIRAHDYTEEHTDTQGRHMRSQEEEGGGWNREHPSRLMTFMLFWEGAWTRAKETYALITQPTAMWPCSNVWTPNYSISTLQIFSTKKTKRAVEKMKSLRGNNLTKKTV